MNPLTEDRLALAAELAEALDFWVSDGTPPPVDALGTVYPSPPPGITTPCLVITPSPTGGTVLTFDSWSIPLDVWLYAEGLDYTSLEDALAVVLPLYPLSSFEPPQASQYGGTTYLASQFTVDRNVVL